MPIFHKLMRFFRVLMKSQNVVWLKFLNGSVKQHHFYPVKNSCLQQAVLLHVALNANELCSPCPSIPGRSLRDGKL